jgi:predicted amidohydrolase YtcJ
VRRQDPWAEDGPELGRDENVDLETALAMYTRNAAWIMRLENETGMLRPGMKADLVVLDRNLFDIPATGINDARVELTLVSGEPVYER